MISNDAMEAALPLTHRLNDKGLHLRAKEGTPLARLASAARLESLKLNASVTQDLNGVVPNLAPYVENVTGIDNITRTNLHDTCQAEILASSLRAVRAHLLIARSEVAPAVENLMTSVKANLERTPINELLNMNVTLEYEPSVLQNGTLISMIEKLRDASSVPPDLVMRLPALAFDQIIELMKTGNSELDRDIEMWAKVQGEQPIQAIFNSLFRVEGELFKSFDQAMRDQTHGSTAMLMCFLIGRKLAEDATLEGISMNQEALTAAALEYRNVAGQRLAFVLDRQSRQAKEGLLVLSYTTKNLTVNQAVYKDWLAKGGSNEILFGLLLQPSMRYYIRDIDEIAGVCQTSWARYVAMQTAAESNERFTMVTRFLRQSFVESLTGTETINSSNRDRTLRAIRITAFDRELAQVKPIELDDLAMLCLKLVCRSCFADTDAEAFLTKMVEIQKQNPNLPVAEVATVAGADYVTSWLASQLVITS
jgi:hypothetical protein